MKDHVLQQSYTSILGEATKNEIDDSSILGRWKINSIRFSFLVEITRDVLAVSVSSVA